MTPTPDYTIGDNGLPSILNSKHKETIHKADRLNNQSQPANPEPHHRCWNVDQSKKLLPKRGSTTDTQQQQHHWTTCRLINNVSQTTAAAPSNVTFNYKHHPSYAESDRNGQSGTTKSFWTNQNESHRNNLSGGGVGQRGFSHLDIGERGRLDKSEKERLNHMRRNQC